MNEASKESQSWNLGLKKDAVFEAEVVKSLGFETRCPGWSPGSYTD